MKLEEIKDIRIGSSIVDSIYFGGVKVWPACEPVIIEPSVIFQYIGTNKATDCYYNIENVRAISFNNAIIEAPNNISGSDMNLTGPLEYAPKWETRYYPSYPNGYKAPLAAQCPCVRISENASYVSLTSNSVNSIAFMPYILSPFGPNDEHYPVNIVSFSLFGDNPLEKVSFFDCVNLKKVYFKSTGSLQHAATMFYGCLSLEVLPEINVSNVTDLSYMFSRCSSLKNIPNLILGNNIENMNMMFENCSSLIDTPQLNATFENLKSIVGMFTGCSSLIDPPQLNGTFGNLDRIDGMFQNCSSLVRGIELDTSNVKNADDMYSGCTSLKSLPLYDFGNLTWLDYVLLPGFLYQCYYIEDIGGFKDLGKSFDYIEAEKYDLDNFNLNLSHSPFITRQSFLNIFNNLYDVGTHPTNLPFRIIIEDDCRSRLTNEDIAIATNKGWIVEFWNGVTVN